MLTVLGLPVGRAPQDACAKMREWRKTLTSGGFCLGGRADVYDSMMYNFGPFELNTKRHELRCRGHLVAIAPKAFAVLSYLVAHHARMVSKAELMDAFWSRNASEAALHKTVSQIRKALDVADSDHVFLKTLHGRGFQFMAKPQDMPDHAAPPSQTMLQERRQIAVLCLRMPEGHTVDQQAQERFLQFARDRVAAHHGQLLHMMVNSFTVTFGLNPAYEDSARRAVHCAWQILTMKGAIQQSDMVIAVGIDTGAVTIGGNAKEQDWQAPSDIEVQAKLLAEAAGRNRIMISETARYLLRDEAEADKQGPGYEVTALSALGAGIPSRPHKRPTRFVGRDAELAFLQGSLTKLRSGAFQAVALSGPAGIGKSRLTREFTETLAFDDLTVCKVSCTARLQNSPLAPLRHICANLLPCDVEEFASDPVDAALLRLLVDDVAPSEPDLQGLSNRNRNARNLKLVQRIMAQAAQDKPLLIVFEDVHWLDATSRDIIQAMVRNGGVDRVFLLLTTRPTDTPDMVDSVLHLSPLGREDSLQLIRAMPEHESIDERTATALRDRAGGNPFFLEELVLAAHLGENARQTVPKTVQAVIEIRIGTLPARLRMVLYVMAIAGDEAALDLIAQLTGQSIDLLEQDMIQLVQDGFLFEDENGFGFRHVLLSDTAYTMVEEVDRKRLHAEAASYFAANDPPIRDEVLAWHYQEAGCINTAIRCWTKASYAAMHRSAQVEAVSFAQSGIALMKGGRSLPAEDELRLRLASATSMLAVQGYGAPEVGAELERAQALNAVAGTFKSKVRVLTGLWVHNWVVGQLASSLRYATTLLEMAQTAQEPLLEMHAHACSGEVLTHLGQLDLAMSHLTKGLAQPAEMAASTMANQYGVVTCAAYAAWVAGMKGNIDDVRRYADLSRSLSQARENRFAEAIHSALCAEAFMFVGDVNKTAELANRAIDLSREHGFPFWLGTGLVMQGWALGQSGDFDPALAAIEEGIGIFEKTGAGIQLTNWYGLKAETHLRAGQVQAGLDMGVTALKIAEKTQDKWFTPRLHSTLAELHKSRGDQEASNHHHQCALRLQQASGLADQFALISPISDTHRPNLR